MSTNSERITAHNALIDQAQALVDALPDAGSGGGSVETCTVQFSENGLVGRIIYEAYENGTVVSKQVSINDYQGGVLNDTFENVVIGSSLIADAADSDVPFAINGYATLESYTYDSAFSLYCYTFRINGDCTISDESAD